MPATDEAELGQLLGAFLAAVSFPAGSRPDYAAIPALFLDTGLVIRAIGDAVEVSSVAQFIEPRQQLVDAGRLTAFHESEAAHITEVFGNVAHRMSTYDKAGTQDGSAFAARGVISTQFVRTLAGWRISAMAWDDVRPGLDLPARYA